MNDAIRLLDEVVSAEGAASEYQWEELLVAVQSTFAAGFDPEIERLMLALLRFSGRIRLAKSSEPPHSMSPENMLKSLAVQWLAKQTGLTHLLEMQRVQATASSRALASVVRATIREASRLQACGAERKVEVVGEARLLPRRGESIPLRAPAGGRRPPYSPALSETPIGPEGTSTSQPYRSYRCPLPPRLLEPHGVVKRVLVRENGLLRVAGSRRKRRPIDKPVLA